MEVAYTDFIEKWGNLRMTMTEFLETLDKPAQRTRFETVLQTITTNFPQLKMEIKWRQPMFTDHGTFIIGFSASSKALNVAPEAAAVTKFKVLIEQAGYTYTKNLIRIPWTSVVDLELLNQLIIWQMTTKRDVQTFWR